jgi:hypothetical protein
MYGTNGCPMTPMTPSTANFLTASIGAHWSESRADEKGEENLPPFAERPPILSGGLQF